MQNAANINSEIILRPHNKSDINFVRDSWTKTAYQYSDLKYIVPFDVFASFHKRAVGKILDSPETALIIAGAEGDPDLLLGWICVEKPKKLKGSIVHFLYVKELFRTEGVATQMLNQLNLETPILFTAMTRKSSKILVKHKEYFKRWYFEPSLVNGFIKTETYWYNEKRPSTR